MSYLDGWVMWLLGFAAGAFLGHGIGTRSARKTYEPICAKALALSQFVIEHFEKQKAARGSQE